MMKYVVILASAICLVQSQRPPYAGSSNRYPAVLPQFLDGRDDLVTGAAVANRIDADGDRSSTIPPDLPVDALGDINLVNRIKTWPKEKQPFWFLNWQQIQEHRGDANNRAQPVQTQPNTRSSFAG